MDALAISRKCSAIVIPDKTGMGVYMKIEFYFTILICCITKFLWSLQWSLKIVIPECCYRGYNLENRIPDKSTRG